MPMIGIVIAILVVVGGGASLAAEKALPGEALYSVKVNFNEELREAFSASEAAKINWEEVRTERRLEEAEELTVKSELKADVRAQIEENFNAMAERVKARLQALKSTDAKAAADLSANFETAIKTHERILARLETEDADTKERTEVEHLSGLVHEQADDVAKLRVELEARVSTQAQPDVLAAAQGKLQAAENKIREVQTFIDNNKDRAGEDASILAEERLVVASNLVAQGKAKINAKAYASAFSLFQQAEQKAQEAQLLLQAKLNLQMDIDLGSSAASGASERAGNVNTNGGVNAGVNVHVGY